MNRASRRKSVADFRREAARAELLTYLLPADTPPANKLLHEAILYWRSHVATRRPRCFGCKTTFIDDIQPAAFLLAVPATATAVSVSGLCADCFRLPQDQIEQSALKVLRGLKPGARFEA